MAKSQRPRQHQSRAKRPVEATKSPEDLQSLNLSENRAPLGRGLTAILVAIPAIFLIFLLWKHHPVATAPNVPLPSPAQPNLAWGPKIKMDVVDKFQVSGSVLALRADAQGNLYVLTSGRIDRYKPNATTNGQLAGGIDLSIGGEWMNMAFDGNHFYVTAVGPTICEVNKDLTKVENTFHVKDAFALFGIAASPQGHIYAADVQTHAVDILDSNGKKLGEFGSPTDSQGSLICPVDVAFDSAGGIYTHDHLSSRIDHFSPDGKLIASWPVPWSAHNWERFCVVQDKIYIDGYNDHRLFIQDLEGHNIGQCIELNDGTALDQPQMVGSGLDGFLYVDEANTIYKLKPWDHPAPLPSENAPSPVSPSAAK